MNNQSAVRLSGVNKNYPHFSLSDVDLDVARGSIMGLIGPNGAGKSTALRIMMGLVRPDSGTVNVLGREIPSEQVAAKWRIGFASEDMRLYQPATLEWHMAFMQGLYADWDSAYADMLVQRFDLRKDQKIKGMSHGQRVKSGLLLVLARRPQLLLLDEPTTGLDPVARREVLNELMDVLADEDRTILFSSHNTKDVEQLSDTITFIDRGRIIASQDKEIFIENWRRIRFEPPEGFKLPALAGTTESHLNGRLANMVTRRFGPHVTRALQENGATVHAVERLTLEEIFVAEVMGSREGDNT
ncbi:MAG: ABC transporter ATP-binding protein [Lysobacterales bacterium]